MTLKECTFVLQDKDLNRLIKKFVPANKKVSNLSARLEHEKLLIIGRLNLLLNINFQATVMLSYNRSEIIARLDHVRPADAIIGQIKEKILAKIAQNADFIKHDADNDTLRINVNGALSRKLESSNLIISKLTATPNNLTLSLNGDLSL